MKLRDERVHMCESPFSAGERSASLRQGELSRWAGRTIGSIAGAEESRIMRLADHRVIKAACLCSLHSAVEAGKFSGEIQPDFSKIAYS